MTTTVWITTYALTKGVYSKEAEIRGSLASIGVWHNANGEQNHHGEGTNWHRTRESAVARAEEMRLAKIASLKKQIERLERMRFE